MKSLNYVFSNNGIKMKRRKKNSQGQTVENFGFRERGGSFRTVALAMKWGVTMRQIGKKYTCNPDIEIDDSYQGVLKEYESGITRFRKLVEMICRMIRVIKVFSEHASDTGRPVLVGRLEDKRPRNLQIPLHPLSFNPKLFSLREYQYRMEPEAKRILQLPWINRTGDDVHRVWQALRHLKQFRNMTSSMQMTVSKYARYEMHGKNRTIVRKGDPGRHYYFIYSGQVEIKNTNVETHVELPKLGPGNDFGHIALLHMERRTASIVCTEYTEFVVLDGRGNGRAVYRALLAEHKRKCNFLKTLEVFDGLDEADYRCLTDHSRLLEHLPTSLVASVERKHPYIYIIMEGVANVALTTDVYTCCVENPEQRELLKQYNKQRNKCNHKPDKLHDVFTKHDPKLSLVIQLLKKGQIFGMQHMLHEEEGRPPQLHLIAKSKLMVMSVPVTSVRYFAKPHALKQYRIYPSVTKLIRRYMEDSMWDLYKAHVIRDLKHFDGRVDPAKKCKYCLPCQLRSLVVPNIIPDPVRDEVTKLYCPGNTSPLPFLACKVFRPRSAPPMVTPRDPHLNFISLTKDISPVVSLVRSSAAAKDARFRSDTLAVGSGNRPGTAAARRSVSRPGTAARSSVSRPGTAARSSVSRPGTAARSSVSRPVTAARSSVSRPGTAARSSVSRPGTAARSSVSRPVTAARSSVSRPGTAARSSVCHPSTAVRNTRAGSATEPPATPDKPSPNSITRNPSCEPVKVRSGSVLKVEGGVPATGKRSVHVQICE